MNSTIILGDFNIDENKKFRIDYGQRLLFQDLEEKLGHHHLTQHVKEPTWERTINGVTKFSTIDHLYTTFEYAEQVIHKTTIYGDHKLILAKINYGEEVEHLEMFRRNWKN